LPPVFIISAQSRVLAGQDSRFVGFLKDGSHCAIAHSCDETA
jgi:hypothetical protein